MSKRNVNWDSNKLNRWLKEKKGQGEGESYKPWLNIQDFPTLGRATRILGQTTGRVHHFFSDIQLRYFYLLEWESSVIDIREHYPLLDLGEVVRDKIDLNFNMFTNKESNLQYVLCTTFLITVRNTDGTSELVARAVKGASELKKSALEKLEIERRYWLAKGISFSLVTNKEIPNTRARNIEWILSTVINDENHSYSQNEIIDLSQVFMERLIQNPKPTRIVISEFEKDFSLSLGTGIYLLKRLIANRQVHINMDEPFNLNKASASLLISEKRTEEEDNRDAIHN